VRIIPDVLRNGFNFSDGVGTVSPSLAAKIATALELDHVPACYQIRYGGVKGVVVVDNHLSHDGDILCVRPSMNKFSSSAEVVEVVQFAKPIPAHLNRQVISILSALGVPDEVFLDLQKQAIVDCSQISVTSAQPVSADSIIKSLEWKAAESSGWATRIAIKMLKAGFSPSEPFLKQLLASLNTKRFGSPCKLHL
jgi:RNA-dependent RNA polymerase